MNYWNGSTGMTTIQWQTMRKWALCTGNLRAKRLTHKTWLSGKQFEKNSKEIRRTWEVEPSAIRQQSQSDTYQITEHCMTQTNRTTQPTQFDRKDAGKASATATAWQRKKIATQFLLHWATVTHKSSPQPATQDKRAERTHVARQGEVSITTKRSTRSKVYTAGNRHISYQYILNPSQCSQDHYRSIFWNPSWRSHNHYWRYQATAANNSMKRQTSSFRKTIHCEDRHLHSNKRLILKADKFIRTNVSLCRRPSAFK